MSFKFFSFEYWQPYDEERTKRAIDTLMKGEKLQHSNIEYLGYHKYEGRIVNYLINNGYSQKDRGTIANNLNKSAWHYYNEEFPIIGINYPKKVRNIIAKLRNMTDEIERKIGLIKN